jgi:hypothetical protein
MKNVAIASKSASEKEPVKALKDIFMSISFLQLLSYFGMPHMRRMDLNNGELSGLDADNAKTFGEGWLKRSVGE